MIHEPQNSAQVPLRRRFYYELVLICLIVSLGAVDSYQIGFYRFRLVDLVLILGMIYFLRLALGRRLERRIVVLVFLYLAYIIGRTVFEIARASDEQYVRTLFGMSATYLAPLIFFVVRESYINYRIAVRLLVVAWAVSLLSQLGLLRWGESYVSGAVNLAPLLGIQRRDELFTLDYMETTITIWRALSVGVTLAVLLARTPRWMKALGLLGLLLQYAGGGGGRSSLLFLVFVPLLFIYFQGSPGRSERPVRLLKALALGFVLAGFYLVAPLGASAPVKTGGTHFDRATEFFVLFTGGWREADARGGFETRTLVVEQYIEGILSDPTVFFLGSGLRQGGAFGWSNLGGLAHNVFLDVWGLTGLIGLIFMLLFLKYVISDLLLLVRSAPEGGKRQVLVYSFSGAVLYMMQYMLFQPTTADRSFMIVFFLTAGLLRPTLRWLSEGETESLRGGA